jgi:regulator of RNase E activity RraB
MLVQRIWTRSENKVQSDATKLMQIWDSGSTRYERTSDTETHWKVIERSLTDSGFTETLLELPAHLTPTDFTWKEESPVRIFKTGFEIPGWKVEIKIIKS